MASHFEYDAELKLLLVTFTGDVRDDDLSHAYRITREFGATHPMPLGILDGTRITSFSVSPEIVKLLAHHPPMFPEDSDRCIVVEQDYLFGMARMYQMLGGGSRERVRVVRTLQEAYEHLQIDAPKHLEAID